MNARLTYAIALSGLAIFDPDALAQADQSSRHRRQLASGKAKTSSADKGAVGELELEFASGPRDLSK
ncbi:hypothetical protein AB9F29_22175, partial [Falsihalocynthiibacter sp. S25ZX9]|uniref:hypothetical protein n=1 Tax=Falsihalocynthiibacter sp. S25ZX9 TaxID=3240870 RepID=UPI00350F5611